jgi:hypothetical protein
MLTVMSTTPPIQYEACPYCFVALEQEPPESPVEPEEAPATVTELEEDDEEYNEEAEEMPEPEPNTVLEKIKTSSPAFLKRFRSLIQNTAEPQKAQEPEIEEETEYEDEETLLDYEEPEYEAFEPQEEETQEDTLEEDTYEPEEPQAPEIQTAKSDAPQSESCPQSFGYLCNRPKDAPIPAECLTCPKIVDCMLKRE